MPKTPRADAKGSPLHGILLIDKEQGWTSHDVVAKARGITHQRKIGHTGTLDPMATGLLVLCLGDATRLVEYMTVHDKEYEGAITLGVTTDTDDADGSTIATAPVPDISTTALAEVERSFLGSLMQRPPAYSAVSVGGQRAYAAARRGSPVALPERPVVVHDLQLVPLPGTRLQIRLRCGPGTYVRSLARDIGEALGCGAHLSRLRRTRVGSFEVSDAVTLPHLADACSVGLLDGLLLPPDEGIREMCAGILSPGGASSFEHGNAIDCATAPVRDQRIRIYDTAGSFFGVGEISGSSRLKPLKVLANSR